jgi:hypothetical protein
MTGLHVRSSKVEFGTSSSGGGNEERNQPGSDAKILPAQRIAMLETYPQNMLQCCKKTLFRPGRHGISFIEALRSSSGSFTRQSYRCWMFKTFWIKGCF